MSAPDRYGFAIALAARSNRTHSGRGSRSRGARRCTSKKILGVHVDAPLSGLGVHEMTGWGASGCTSKVWDTA